MDLPTPPLPLTTPMTFFTELFSFNGSSILSGFSRDEQAAEVDAAGQHADERHKDVVDQRRGNRAERGADDHADSHIDDIAAHRKRLEVLKEFFHGYLSSLFML